MKRSATSALDDRAALIERHRPDILRDVRIPTKSGFVDAEDASINQIWQAAALHKRLAELHVEAASKIYRLAEQKRLSR